MAESCFPIYEAEANKIREKKAYTETVGASLYVHNGQLAVWPGIEVPGKIDNWAQDFVDSIKWGHNPMLLGESDSRAAWLKSFNNSIKKSCPLPDDNHATLRKMLQALMDDGSFCLNSEIIKPKFLKSKGEFKDVLKKAVSDQRFADYCQSNSVADDSFRNIKDVENKKSSATKLKGAQKQ